MPQLKSFKNRIATVGKIGKITSTMGMVSASRLRKVLDRKDKLEAYCGGCEEFLAEALKDWDANLLPKIVTGGNGGGKHLLVVVGSSRGLCGGLNTWVLRVLKSRTAVLGESGIEFALFPVGKRLISLCKGSFSDFVGIEKRISQSASEAISQKVTRLFQEEKVASVEVIYPVFVSTMVQKAYLIPLLPIYSDKRFAGLHKRTTCAVRDPDKKDILYSAVEMYVKSSMMRVIAHAISSETAARMVSMDNASRKCGKLSSSLVLECNEERQNAITNELLEVISGMEALDT